MKFPTPPSEIASARADFPIFKREVHGHPLIYLDSAATTHKPQAVIDAIAHFYAEEYSTVHRSIYALAAGATERYNAVREKVRAWINAARSDEIVFTRGTTEAINLVAHSFGKRFLEAGETVIISAMEHHSNMVPWQQMCKERGANLEVIPMDERGELDLDWLERKLKQGKTKLVAVAHIGNVTGTHNPIEKIVSLAHAHGAKVLIDGAQAVSHIPVDVQAIGCDFYAFSGHKMYGPTGIGVLYGKRELLAEMPPYQFGGDMVDRVTFEQATFQEPPLKFEAGTPLIAEVIGLGAAIDYIEQFGRENIARYEAALLESATRQMKKIPGLEIIGTAKKKGAIVTFTFKGIHSLDIATLLDLQGIAIRSGNLCAQPALAHFGLTTACRLSLGLYNTEDDITHFCTALKRVVTQLSNS
jgi:cysteine desulfurase/selenocysteine lyase